MKIDQLISSAVPTLSAGDTGNRALEVMEDNNLLQLPVVTDDNYIALVAESDLLDWDKTSDALSTAPFMTFRPAIASSAHPFEALRLVNEMNLSVLPILDAEQKYIGSVTKDALLKYITENSGIAMPGGIIVLEVAPRNYTLYEIARICENEDVVIMNTQVHANELGMLEVTLKLNRTALDPVVSSLERHNYRVTEVYGDATNNEDIADKYNLLMNYINM
jgi:acetoin utilization protein AcuB